MPRQKKRDVCELPMPLGGAQELGLVYVGTNWGPIPELRAPPRGFKKRDSLAVSEQGPLFLAVSRGPRSQFKILLVV